MSKRTLAVGLLAIPALLLAWWLISPLFITRTVNESFPAVTGGSPTDAVAIPTTIAESDAVSLEPSADVTNPMAEGDDSVSESATDTADTVAEGDDSTSESATDAPDTMAEGEDSVSESPADVADTVAESDDSMAESSADAPDMVAESDNSMSEVEVISEAETEVVAAPVWYPQVVAQGDFYPLQHAGRGTATIYTLEDGSRTLRFENFLVDNGPALAVWLVPLESVPNQIGVVPQGYVELAKLKGNEGNQNYEIPADLDLSLYKSVVVWCVTFSVPFTAAPLTPATPTESASMEDATANAAEEIAMPSYEPIPLTVGLQDLGAAPEITNETWLNSDAPLRLADLKGKVVVVEFWTYDCYNCQNVTPHIQAWHEKYGGDNFQMLSVHYPEFTYEREIENVRAAVNQAGITYPVAIDNEGVTWRAYEQRYWPVWYVIDQQGIIRYKHIGEGGYAETEGVIQALLAES